MRERIKRFFREVARILKMPEMGILPGQLAFFLVLAFVPTISLISYVATCLNLSADFLYDFLSSAFSKDLAGLVVNSDILSYSSGGLKFIITLVFAYYIASNGANSIILTSNTIYGVKSSGFFTRRLKAFVMTFILIFLIIFIFLIPLFGDNVLNMIQYMSLSDNVESKLTAVIRFLQSPINWFVIFLIIKLLYTMAPDRKVESSKVNYGAIFTTICFVLGTSVYSYYINHLANYNAFYGALANLIVLVLWFYYLAFVFTIGMALNYHKEEEENERTRELKTVKDE